MELRDEVDNPVDPNAVAFMCDIGDGFQWIEYVVKEATAAVRDAIARNDITIVVALDILLL